MSVRPEHTGEGEDVARVLVNILCHKHRMPDCSPLLNGCSEVTGSLAALDRLAALVDRQATNIKVLYRQRRKVEEEHEALVAQHRDTQESLAAALAALPDPATRPQWGPDDFRHAITQARDALASVRARTP